MHVLDVGCGGGMNVRRMLKLCPKGQVTGVDISVTSVKKSQQVNEEALGQRCDILLASVEQLPFPAESFDAVTTFETTYFWPDLDQGLRECCRVLKPGGKMLVTCSFSDPESLLNRLVEGMRICTPARLEECFAQAGLTNIVTDTTRSGWVCVTGTKPIEE